MATMTRYSPGMTYEMYLEAVKNNWRALKHVPDEMKTPEICLEAVRNNWEAVEYAPKKMAPELYLEAVKHDGDVLEYIPKKARTLKVCLEAVKQRGRLSLLRGRLLSGHSVAESLTQFSL